MRLPLSVYSSGLGPDRVFDLADERERIELYQIVLTDGTEDDVCRYIDRHELQRLWPRLWLPDHVRAAWAPHLGLAAPSR
ncbi:MAG: transcriptional regulator [Sporichthyaceae bacterium]|nr:transcriptional regulator [Sporichthyaceae bacterium]